MGGRGAWLMLAGMLMGCAREPERPAGAGAEPAVRTDFEALVRRDWQAAYAVVSSDSRKRVPADQFTELARAYRRRLGFEPSGVTVRACEERGAEAIAHVVSPGEPVHGGSFTKTRLRYAVNSKVGAWCCYSVDTAACG